MPELRCKIMIEENVQCPTVLIVAEPVSENASYICRNHPDSVQRVAAGNTKQPRPNVHFQEYQFDPDMERSTKPSGTKHINTIHKQRYLGGQFAPARALKKEVDE